MVEIFLRMIYNTVISEKNKKCTVVIAKQVRLWTDFSL